MAEHTIRDRQPGIVQAYTLPLTGACWIDRIVKTLAAMDVTDRALCLIETAPGVTEQDVRSRRPGPGPNGIDPEPAASGSRPAIGVTEGVSGRSAQPDSTGSFAVSRVVLASSSPGVSAAAISARTRCV